MSAGWEYTPIIPTFARQARGGLTGKKVSKSLHDPAMWIYVPSSRPFIKNGPVRQERARGSGDLAVKISSEVPVYKPSTY